MTMRAPWFLQELVDYGHTNSSNITLMVPSKTGILWSRMINLRHVARRLMIQCM